MPEPIMHTFVLILSITKKLILLERCRFEKLRIAEHRCTVGSNVARASRLRRAAAETAALPSMQMEQKDAYSLKNIASFSAFTLMGAIALLWLAIYNGFPPLYWDSAGYIRDWSQWIRPIGYNVFIRFTALGVSLWFTVFAQALITSYLMMRTAVIFLRQDSLATSFASFVVLLSVILLTTLSKYTSWLMPDIFTSWIFFALFLFLMGPAWLDRLVAIVILVLSFFSHLSHLPLVILLLTMIATANLFSPRIRETFKWTRIIQLTMVCVVITVLICTTNYFRIGSFGLSYQSSGNFKISHMISWGVAQKVLKEECAIRKWRLCGYQKELQAATGKRHDWFLWNKNSPLRKVGGWEDQREQNEIVQYALHHHLAEVIRFAFRDGYRQWTILSDSRGFLPARERLQRGSGAGYNTYYLPVIKAYPGDAKRLDQSRLSQGTLNVHRIIPFHISVAIAWALSLVTIVFFASKKQYLPLAFIGSSVIFVTFNAFLTGALAGVANRKLARVAWIVLYAVLLSIISYALARRKTPAKSRRTSMPPEWRPSSSPP